MENLNPYDMERKREIHPDTDEKNFIEERQGVLILCCGAKKKKGKEGFCRSFAGSGTNHPGFGRCKFCGGASTGPKTPEGQGRVGQNSRKHGLYARYLTHEEQAVYEELQQKKDLTPIEEIHFLRTKLVTYMLHVEKIRKKSGLKGLRRKRIKDGWAAWYEMGSIDDPNIHKTLEQIRRLLATAKNVEVPNSQTILDEINSELRFASQKQAQVSWIGLSQQRVDDH